MVEVQKTDFNEILNTAELLVEKVEKAFSQDEIAKQRMEDIKIGKVQIKKEQELDAYLKKRGVKLE